MAKQLSRRPSKKAPPATVRVRSLVALARLGEATLELPGSVWNGGLPDSQEAELDRECWRLCDSLITAIRAHADWPTWEREGRQVLEGLRVLFQDHRGQPRSLVDFRMHPNPHDTVRAGAALARIIDAVFDRSYIIHVGKRRGHTSHNPLVLEQVSPFAQPISELSRTMLIATGQPRDKWHVATTAAFLLLPTGYREAVTLPFWLRSSAAEHGTELERQADWAVGASTDTERAASKVLRDHRDRLGFVAPTAKPGPKPGSRNRPTGESEALSKYLLERARAGVSAAMIATDAEAQRRYRKARGNDHAAELTENTVRRVIREAREER